MPATEMPSYAPRIGILLINLGTPDAPTPAATRRYLRAFLSDRRAVDLPRLVWWPILHGIVLRLRPRRSAAKYARIWSEQGSPLLVHTRAQADALARELVRREVPAQVEFAMRHGQPSVAAAVERLVAAGVDRIVALPLYPQYAASSTASAFDAVFAAMGAQRAMPALLTVRDYHDDPGYIAALAASVRAHWAASGRPDRLLMSFHGVPCANIRKGDPYVFQCRETARLLAAALGLEEAEWHVAFQSRFGRAAWLRPHTLDVVRQWGRQGIGRVDVLCPGFAGDCLETLEEIDMEVRAAFLSAGGGAFHYIPALNAQPAWIAALADLVVRQAGQWIIDGPRPALPPNPAAWRCDDCHCRKRFLPAD